MLFVAQSRMQNFKIGHRTKKRDTVDCFLKIAFSNDVSN